MPSPIEVSFVVVAFRNDEQNVHALVQALLEGASRASITAEAVIVLNDDSEWPNFEAQTVINGHGNIGFAGGMKLGVHACQGRYVVMVNPDCYVEPSDVSVFLRDLRQCDGVLMPLLVNERGQIDYPPYENWVFTPGRLFAHRVCKAYLTRTRWEHVPRFVKVPGTFVGMRTALALELNAPFDTNFFLYGEDRDLTNRLRKLHVPMKLTREARVVHVGGESGKTVSVLVERAKSDSAMRIAYRRYGRCGAALAAVDLVVVAAVKELLRRERLMGARWWSVKRWKNGGFAEPEPLTALILEDKLTAMKIT